MKSISLYEERGSFLNGLTPGTKGLYILCAVLIPVILGEILLGLIPIAISLMLLAQSGVLKKAVPMMLMSGFVVATVVVIQGLFRPGNITPVLELGFLVFYQEGLLFALDIVVNIMNIVLSVSVLVLTTKPSDMVDALVRRGLSPRIGYVFVSLFLLIPQMTERMATISDSQRSRGMETEGNLFVRARAFVPLISPVMMGALMDTKERSIALEVRGFNAKNKKSFYNEFKANKADKMLFILLVICFVASLVGRVILWLI